MIPLIDISMVLLVFFIMIRPPGALAPVDVPDMQYAGQLSSDARGHHDQHREGTTEDVYYSVRVGRAPARPEHDQTCRRQRRRSKQSMDAFESAGTAAAGGAHRLPQGFTAQTGLRTAPRAGTAPQEGDDQYHRGDGGGSTRAEVIRPT